MLLLFCEPESAQHRAKSVPSLLMQRRHLLSSVVRMTDHAQLPCVLDDTRARLFALHPQFMSY